jgi:hypothetical protein
MANWSVRRRRRRGVDKDEIKRLSDDLVHWNCAYQQALGESASAPRPPTSSPKKP